MRGSLRCLMLVLSAALLGGCAATVSREPGAQPTLAVPAESAQKVLLVVRGSPAAEASADWQLLRTEWRTAMAAAAAQASLGFEYLEREPPLPPGAATLVVVKVNDYRYLSPGARFGFGVFTGNAFLDADVDFYALPGRRAVGSRKLSTSSSAWQGVFSAMTDKQVQALAADIVSDIRKR